MNKSSISIVIPIFNSSNYIDNTLMSVISACGEYPFEIILVDDMSNDIKTTEGIIRKYPHVKLIRKRIKSNAAESRNIGFNESTSQFVFFLDSDDCYRNDYINHRMLLMKSNSVGVFFGGFISNIRNKTQVISSLNYHNNDIRDYIFKEGGDFRTSTISINKQHHRGTLFDPLQAKHQDWGFGIRCYDSREAILYDEHSLVQINMGLNSQMSDSMNVPASKYFIETYLGEKEHQYIFSKKHLLIAIKNEDAAAINFFISTIIKCDISPANSLIHSILLYATKCRVHLFIYLTIKVLSRLKRTVY